jgi:hypothetical protein
VGSLALRLFVMVLAREHLTFKCLFHINSFLCAGFKVRQFPFGLTERHGALRGDHPFALFHVDLIADDNLCPAVGYLPLNRLET